ncbi:MAG TPA: hypothetical protein PKE53_06185, partial [Flavobacteriales bacterium]|nr:hypothetical protein [Flavobacteriales bacterium]
MSITKQDLKQRLEAGDIQGIFVKLGWNRSSGKRPLKVAERDIVQAELVAEKKDFFVAVVKTAEPTDKARRQKIEKQFTKFHAEHLIVYIDGNGGQVWQLAVRRPQQPIGYHEVPWHKGQKPELLYEKLTGLFVALDEEDSITVIDVTDRARRQFEANTKRVVKKFYTQFGQQHKAFVTFIKGLDATADREWYASLMLNRLMFIYFIQKKGFLDKDHGYLRTKLTESRARKGKDKFYQGFYRSFLLRLFHEGLGKLDHAKLEKEIGRVPYLNGGLFDVHHLEKPGTINITDEAFEKLFDFFDGWQWTLDIRPDAPGDEINPDVIGYIFEQYINERAKMGAYYTQEDITHYIGRNTIIPWLFDKAKEKDAQAFKPEGGVWALLRENPDHYIHQSVQKGITPAMREALDAEFALIPGPSPKEKGAMQPWWQSSLFADLPAEVRKGLNPEQKDLWKIRKAWNKSPLAPGPSPEERGASDIALPTEIYRELIDRRRRYLEVRRKLKAGEVTAINDLITYNLDIVEFAQDVLRETESGDLVWAFYDAIRQVTVLDPTCGSGAFLFAALNILQPLYAVCLERMAEFRQQALEQKKPQRYKQFQPILDDMAQHPSPRYYILKSIILRNLYGVDIMAEAVEIAKLRLFLKLVSVLEPDYTKPNMGIEPLPDIDFNIRAGNTLVGFGTRAELEKGLTADMEAAELRPEIEKECDVVARAFERYKQIQLSEGEDYAAFRDAKETLLQRLKTLRAMLDRVQGKLYSKHPDYKGGKEYDAWKESHKPFHWFAEYYGIVEGRGGFDVIIGNPPYVEMLAAEKSYKIINDAINTGGNLHTVVAARSLQLMTTRANLSFIVPVAIANTERMQAIRKRLATHRTVWISNFSIRPGKLFSGAEQRLAIYILRPEADNSSDAFTTKYMKWATEERSSLFERLCFQRADIKSTIVWTKVPGAEAASVFQKMRGQDDVVAKHAKGSHLLYYKNTGINYYVTTTLRPPECFINGKRTPSSRETTITFESEAALRFFHGLFSSSLFFVWYQGHSNCRDLNPSDLTTVPFPSSILKDKGFT